MRPRIETSFPDGDVREERVMGILKVRDDAYDGRMRELQITDAGLVLLDTFAAESRVATGGGFGTDTRTTDSKG